MALRGDLESTITPDATTAPFATAARLGLPSTTGRVRIVSQRFLRCLHCGLPHALEDAVCSITGRPIEARRAAAR
ncbi:MAG: hypothetical protein ACHREM_33865, partial [Polyangiales bacterium]